MLYNSKNRSYEKRSTYIKDFSESCLVRGDSWKYKEEKLGAGRSIKGDLFGYARYSERVC